MSARAELIVVGAGLSGLLTALKLVESGLQPLVVPARPTADLLPPLDDSLLPPWQQPAVIRQLEARSISLLPGMLTRLSQDTGVDLGLERRSLIALEARKDGARTWSDSASLQWGQIADFEPQLAQGHRSALRCADRCAVRVDHLVRALRLALKQRGVVVHDRSCVHRLEVAGNIVLGVALENHENLRAEATVLAAEQASSALLFDSGLDAIEGGASWGAALQFAPSSARLGALVMADELLLAPRVDGRLVGMALTGGEPGRVGHDWLRRQVHSLLPGLGRHDLEVSGRLPVPGERSKAAIGAYPGMRGFWLNVGHDPFGPLIAPAAAEFLVEQLAGGPAVRELAATFSPSMQPSC